MNSLDNIKKVTIIGAGGGAGFYIAKLLRLLDKKVDCFDIHKNQNTIELESLGAIVNYANPTDFVFKDSDFIIHTRALSAELINQIVTNNPAEKITTSGEFYEKIVEEYQDGEYENSTEIKDAIKKSQIAPLFEIDFGDCILIGITGSKGKTTTSYMMYETLHNLGAEVSCCTTIGAKVMGRDIETGLHTSTPSAQELAYLFKEMLKAKSKIIVLEASSHAIATGRISGLKFDIGVITNIQPEHLDFHKTIQHVIDTKKQVVLDYLKPNGIAILNTDDENIRDVILPQVSKHTSNILTFGENEFSSSKSHAIPKNIQETEKQVSFELSHPNSDLSISCNVPFPGKFNVLNIIPSIYVANEFGYKGAEIANAVQNIGTVSGRNEILQETPFKVVLDFAHTPESLEAILGTYSRTKVPEGKVIVVFGAAGQRDALKRPRMGAAAAKYADITILTAEDPRTEDLNVINSQIKVGWEEYVKANEAGSERQILEYNDISIGTRCRSDAIAKAVSLAVPGDIIICAGKGPEKSMCIGVEEYPWDEKEALLNALKTK